MAERALEDLVARLERERLDADRAYNEALTRLDRIVQRPLPTWPAPPAPADEALLAEANRSWDILPGGPPEPGRGFKGRLRTFVWRLTHPPLQRQKQFNAAVVQHLNAQAAASRDAAAAVTAVVDMARREIETLAAFQSALVQYLQTITLYVDTKDRSLGGPALREQIVFAQERTLAVKRDVERLMAGTGLSGVATAGPPAAAIAQSAGETFTYVGFEDRFRGSREEIRRRLREYLPLLEGAKDVLDVGCGRGEFLELMREAGVAARGIDANPEMVEVCRERGLAAERADALSYVSALSERALGGLTAIQVVEHFDPRYLARFLEAAHRALRPASAFVLETINPSCWMAFFETYIRDPTHVRPLHPDTLRFLAEASGFSNVEIVYRAPVGEGDRLPRVDPPSDAALAELADTINAHADRLNQRLFGSMDYALVARR